MDTLPFVDFFRHLFDTTGFPARWHCGMWSEGHGWLHIISDLLVFGAYAAIPSALWYFIVTKRQAVPFPRLFWLFGAFILSCGITHFIDATLFWHPWYRLSGLMKLVTAVVSWATAIVLIRAIPLALTLPGIHDLNVRLKKEIDQRKAVELELERALSSERGMRGAAEEANRMKEKFLAMLSHELRTPLNAVMGYTELIRDEHGGDKELSEMLAVIERNTLAQKQMVDDLLDTQRIINGKLRLSLQETSLSAVVDLVLTDLRPSFEAKRLVIQKTREDAPAMVWGDPGRLQQVLNNLVTNAIKFTPEGGQIEVGLRKVEEGFELWVSDNGVGLIEEDLKSVFEPFKQIMPSAGTHAGIGLGLPICHSIIEMHGGSIVAESKGLGQGTTFRMVLPSRATGAEDGAA